MEIIKTSLICFVVCVASASAFGAFRGEAGELVSTSDIWVNKPVNDESYPVFAPFGNENNGEGLTLSAYCDYVVENKATPWPCPKQTVDVNGSRTNKPTMEIITEFCTKIVNNNYMFTMPARRGPSQEESVAKRNIATEEKRPGL